MTRLLLCSYAFVFAMLSNSSLETLLVLSVLVIWSRPAFFFDRDNDLAAVSSSYGLRFSSRLSASAAAECWPPISATENIGFQRPKLGSGSEGDG